MDMIEYIVLTSFIIWSSLNVLILFSFEFEMFNIQSQPGGIWHFYIDSELLIKYNMIFLLRHNAFKIGIRFSYSINFYKNYMHPICLINLKAL